MSPEAGRMVLHLAVGAELTAFALDTTTLALTPGPSVTLPERVQYAWAHPRLPLLYVAFSSRGTPGRAERHGIAAFRIDPATGALSALGAPVAVDSRPIHLTLDPDGRFLLLAYNQPSMVSVHRLEADGAIGAPVRQAVPVEAGVYAHQLRVAPSGRYVVVVARGNDATAEQPEEPGSLRLFAFRDGQLSPLAVAGETPGYGPRHIDFHPIRPWIYVSMERSNELLVYAVAEDGGALTLLARRETLFPGADRRTPEQYAGAIHVHPDGRHLYVVNRSDGTVPFQGQAVHGAGENSIACFAIDPESGVPELVRAEDARGFHCRSFSIHPGGRVLVAAAVAPMLVREGEQVRRVPAGLSLFRLEADGRLRFQGRREIEAGGQPLFWCGFTPLPG